MIVFFREMSKGEASVKAEFLLPIKAVPKSDPPGQTEEPFDNAADVVGDVAKSDRSRFANALFIRSQSAGRHERYAKK